MPDWMDTLREINLPVHIIFGAGTLLLFWMQIFSKKGSSRHIFFGRAFYWAGQGVVVTALYATTHSLVNYFGNEGQLADGGAQLGAVFLLGYLALVGFAMLERARSAVRFKGPSPGLRAIFPWMRSIVTASASLWLIAYSLLHAPSNSLLLLILSPLGVLIAAETLHFQLKHQRSTHHWVEQHIDGMFGAGIAFHTAFMIFGANRFFDALLADTPYQMVPWLLPAAIGIPAAMIWKRFARRYAE